MSQKRLVRLLLRWATQKDLDEIQRIENASFEYPWATEDFQHFLRSRNCIGMVVTLDEIIVGYVAYRLEKRFIRIENFAVHPDFRRLGVGRAIVEKIASKLTKQRRHYAVAEVRERNLPAQQFFKAMGFFCSRIIDGRYVCDAGIEDAYEMRLYHDRREVWPVCRNRNRISHLVS